MHVTYVICTCTHTCVCMYVCMYVCILYIYIYIYSYALKEGQGSHSPGGQRALSTLGKAAAAPATGCAPRGRPGISFCFEGLSF